MQSASKQPWMVPFSTFFSATCHQTITTSIHRGGKPSLLPATITAAKTIEGLLRMSLTFDLPLGSWGTCWWQQQVNPLVCLDAIVVSLSSLFTSIQEVTTTRIQQSSIREDKGGRSWRLHSIITWYCCGLIAVAILVGGNSNMQRALSVREEKELVSSCSATNADNNYDNWRGQWHDGYCHCQLPPH